jgi:hypothetical protein
MIYYLGMPKGSYVGPAIVVFLMIAVIIWFLYQGLASQGGLSPGNIPGHS